jgi:hypothetical protein
VLQGVEDTRVALLPFYASPCSSHRAGARVREAALPHRFSAAHTLAWPSRVFSFFLKHTCGSAVIASIL